MFLIFNLQTLDVVPAADLGIRGVQLAYGLKSLPTPELVYKTALRLAAVQKHCFYLLMECS